ncbi:MAG: hypothetical protein WAR79_06685 [Melioribacteraceae bacterium]
MNCITLNKLCNNLYLRTNQTYFCFVLVFFFLNINLIVQANEIEKLKIEYGTNGEIIFVVDHLIHQNYGVAYPITYKIEFPPNNFQLTAFKRTSKKDEWVIINPKTKNDLFNGIEAARFENDSNFVYISVTFSSESDSLFIKVSNSIGNNLMTYYKGICKYYDNRKAVVTTTADDLIHHTYGFIKAFNAFRSRNLWLSCGAVTGYMYETQWNDLQMELDLGYVEINSHSYSHKPPPYEDTYLEIVGSRQDIINNLNLPALYSNGDREYVYSYIYPFGGWGGSIIDSTSGQNGYLINRTVVPEEHSLTDWNSEYNMFNRVGVVYEVGGVYEDFKGVSDINILNNTFNQVVEQEGIYHFSIHPNDIEEVGDWEKPYMSEHLDYISNRKNIWYVGFGILYLYHLIQSSDINPVSTNLNLKVFLEGAYLNSEEMSTFLDENLPKKHPYNTEPWNYSGDESFSIIPNNDITDWVLVSLKQNLEDETFISRRVCLLKKDGTIVDVDGESFLRFNVSPGDYYVVIQHRNHLSIVSPSPIHF